MSKIYFSAMILLMSACASSPVVKSQDYAKMPGSHFYEHEFPSVWKGVEAALKNYKILERDPEEVSSVEMKNLTQRTLETDWIYSQSQDKYQEYQVNGSPRKKYLQLRYKHEIVAKRAVGGTEIAVKTVEEIEKLKPDGTSLGFSQSDSTSPSLSHDLLEKINLAVLSNPPE